MNLKKSVPGLSNTHYWFLSYRNQSSELLCKSMDWFLYDRDLPHERVKGGLQPSYPKVCS